MQPRRPSTKTVTLLAATLLILSLAGFAAGFAPRARVKAQVAEETRNGSLALPVVHVAPVTRATAERDVRLPATVQAEAEVPVLARTDGYLKNRFVDIGDRVSAGQVVAEIDAPEADQQVSQAAAAVEEARATVEQTKAAVEQARANETLARTTAERWANLLLKGAVSRQEHDVYHAQHQAQAASRQSLERARMAAEKQLAAMEANHERLMQIRSYRQVRAPFSGVITMRNVDTGALISGGQTLLFRIAQDNSVRAYVNVPQRYAQYVQTGQPARLEVADRPGRIFEGKLARNADALDPSSRTLLAEVRIENRDGALRPGAYGEVLLRISGEKPLVIPANSVVVAGGTPQVPTVASDGRVVFQRVTLGRDHGREIEVLAGLDEGDTVIVNPGDAVREGIRVRPQLVSARRS